jgi:hypothetical protein
MEAQNAVGHTNSTGFGASCQVLREGKRGVCLQWGESSGYAASVRSRDLCTTPYPTARTTHTNSF